MRYVIPLVILVLLTITTAAQATAEETCSGILVEWKGLHICIGTSK